MSDQVLILRRDNPLDFVANACAALADSVNELRMSRVGDHLLIETYAEMLRAYSNLLRPALVGDPRCAVQVKVIDHLVERLDQARPAKSASRCLTSLTAFMRNSSDNHYRSDFRGGIPLLTPVQEPRGFSWVDECPVGGARRASGGSDPIPPGEGVLGRRWKLRGTRGRVQGRSTSSRRSRSRRLHGSGNARSRPPRLQLRSPLGTAPGRKIRGPKRGTIGFYPGQTILFGNHRPSTREPLTYRRRTGHI